MRVCSSPSSGPEVENCRTGMVEIRLDLVDRVPEARGRDLLVTYRGPVDLGLLPEGFSGMIDIGEEPRPETPLTVVASHHDYGSTPSAERIAALLNGMDCDVAKAAFAVGSPQDLVSILDASRSVKRRHVLLGMGPLGTVTRVRSALLGNEFTFGYVGSPTAPGQLSADEMKRLGDDCVLLGIVGDPVSKSLSPAMHSAALEASGVNGVYLPLPCAELDQIEEVVRGYGVRGLNVTIPHKRAAMDHVDRVDGDASAIGAINTIVNEGGVLTGFNTDVAGIETALGRAGFELEDRRVLVMGSGGAARSMLHLAAKRGCDATVTGRNEASGTEVSAEFGAEFSRPDDVSVKAYDLVVNCTPVGMYSDGPYPVNVSSLGKDQTVLDMTYGRETPLRSAAAARGCRVATGEDMLAGQGAESFRLWTGVGGMFDVMRDAVGREEGLRCLPSARPTGRSPWSTPCRAAWGRPSAWRWRPGPRSPPGGPGAPSP